MQQIGCKFDFSKGIAHIEMLAWLEPFAAPMASHLPITTTCYGQRLNELKQQIGILEQQSQQEDLSEELECLLHQQIRGLNAALWAIHAETEQDLQL